MNDSDNAEQQRGSAIILYDGVCKLCNGVVQFVLKFDRNKIFRFAALQSEVGQKLLREAGVEPGGMESIVLIEQDRASMRSTAALRIARRLPMPWSCLYALVLVPQRLRDALYSAVARNRYRWFGRSESCMLPSAEVRQRFLD